MVPNVQGYSTKGGLVLEGGFGPRVLLDGFAGKIGFRV